MTIVTRLAAGFVCLATLATLSACGDLDTSRTSVAGRIVTALFSGPAPPAAPLTRPGFTAAELAADPDRFRLVSIESMGLAEPARLIGSGGGRETWEGESGFTAIYVDGMLAATHGLIFDLIAADGAATRAALRQGGGETTRSIEMMDSQDQLTRIDLTCTVTDAGPESVNLGTREVQARRFIESCRSAVLILENRYWLDSRGQIVSSLQYVSPTVAYLRSNRL